MADTALQVAARYFDDEMIEPLRQSLIGRKLVAENPNFRGDGKYNVDINTIIEMGDAMISYTIPQGDKTRDMIRVDRSNVRLPVLYKEFEVPRMDFEAWKTQGVPLDAAAAISAGQVVGVKEDALIINGWSPDGSTYQVNGLYQGAGNSYSTSKDFGTAGNATIAVAGALSLIEADSALASAYNLVLNATQWGELLAARMSNGDREMPQVVEMLNLGGGNAGRIYVSSSITAGTGLMVPIDPARQYMELYVPQQYRTDLGIDSKQPNTSNLYGVVYGMVYPHIKHSEAICTLTAI